MKARVLQTPSQVKKIVKAETDKRVETIYEAAFQNASYGCYAVFMSVLAKKYGFGKKRLHRLKDDIEDEFMLMHTGILGRDYTKLDCVKFLDEKYDLRFSESQYNKGD